MLEESKLDPSSLEGTGKDGRITKGDVLDGLGTSTPQTQTLAEPEPTKAAALPRTPQPAAVPAEPETREPSSLAFGQRKENPVPIPRIRRKIAQRLKEVQNTAAILTTFNEVDMSEILRLRQEYKETFEKRHGIKLGFMGFFVKAAVEALRRVPDVNAEWREDTLVYKSYQDIGVAVSTGKGLVVPVIREAGSLSLAEVEKEIGRLAKKGRDGALGIDDMSGGTFTITNGGVFGSLLSTPILNPPQTAILGMHKTEKRAVVVGNEIVIRPMMYVALSYDHRVIDGKEAVQFLVTIKDCIENPVRVMLEV
jgi:2-oxoglutarate dehydrogenase E2 component (dihydrolipoamide succinyltransferase)